MNGTPSPHPGRILGVDPGLRVTGYAVLDPRPHRPHICEAGIIRPTDSHKTTDLAPRLATLYDSIEELVAEYRPSVVVVEQIFSHYDHPRTAVLMAHARGVILLAAAKHGVPVRNYTASRVKKTVTGHGRASKEQMQHAMLREFGLPTLPEPADVADALAVALCHHHIGRRAPEGEG